ncbi:MAG TPA: DUF5110 domain-containing protein [Burkholderiaceae bacterium]
MSTRLFLELMAHFEDSPVTRAIMKIANAVNNLSQTLSTGKRCWGGKVVAAKADMATIRLFIRAGSILPPGPVVQYADEKSDETVELRVYPGRNGSFEFYDDAGEGQGYAAGEHAIRRLAWKQASGKLVIALWQGSFPGMRRHQAFIVPCAAAPGDAMRVCRRINPVCARMCEYRMDCS